MSSAPTDESAPHRSQWKTRSGFLFAAIGSAVGLGNIWRFSYISYQNGGGAFLIPYFFAILTAGIPLMILEFGIGHKMRGSAPMTFAKLNPHWEWLGWWMVTFVMFGIVLFYSVVIAWCLNFMLFSLNLAWGADPNDFFFNTFLAKTDGPHVLGNVRFPILLSLLAVWVVNWVIVFFGVARGIERANKIFMPMLFGLVVLLVIWTFTLPGARAGVAQYLKPDFSKLTDLSVWRDAYAQTFFSLSIGFGIMVTYASYLPRKSDITANAIITCLADSAFAILSGLAVFGTLGYMAFQSGKPIADVVTSGIGLAFIAYPEAIALLPAGAPLFGFLFFFTLLVAGISSAISIIEAFASSVIDKFHYPRRVVVTVLSILGFIGGIVFTTGGGLFWLDIVDHFLSQYGLFFACMFQCVLIGWFYKVVKIRDHVNSVSSFKIGFLWTFCIKYLIPGVLIWLLVGGILDEVTKPYEGYSWLALILIGRDWLLLTLIVALFIAARPWRRPIEKGNQH